ncbi:MAG: RNA polymerase factor sigma-54 [Phyllobacteriaceae bacterium]|jgi:RNA polymerase sigma-54 factor|nr:RNA polymerase factor sigma-54 [Phyllobacteriaceae bacterium]
MGLNQKLILKQGQALVMTPQLQQAIKLLQMSSMELQAFVDAELERNPLLEREDNSSDPVESLVEKQSPATLDEAFTSTTTPAEDMGGDAERPDGAAARMADEASMPRDSGWANLRSSGHLSFDGEDGDFAASLSSSISLGEHLTSQLNLAFTAPADLMIGQHLIGMLNEAGYLAGDPLSLCETLKASPEQVERVLEGLRRCEPVGVFARDLAECLKLQLADLDRLDPAMEALVDNLPLVARRDFNALKSKCGVTMEDLQDMLVELRNLNPKPGLAFGTEPTLPVVPDVFVRPSPDGNWIIELNSETLPRVLVNNRYMATVARGAKSEDDKLFLAGCHAQATWLVKSLEQRAKTVLKVAREIVRQQDGFLIHGVQHLRPITLKTVADAIEMHESTVSRVTSNKYIATPLGTYELKYFFTTAIANSVVDGDAHSAESVRHRIREMITHETAAAILSDDDIVAALRGDGIEIARRTVAKYRESLGILSSVQRRREARLKG